MSATILLTCRAGPDAESRENLLAVLRAAAGTPVVLVEQDALPRLALPADLPGLGRVFAFNPGPLHWGWGLNVAARHAGTPWLVFADPDLLVPGAPERVLAPANAGLAMVKPYRDEVALDAADSEAARRDPAAPPWPKGGPATVPPLCAGLFAVRAEVFWRLGGFDERFVSAGAAARAFGDKVERARLPAVQFEDTPALRLWRLRAPEPQAPADEALLARLRTLGAAEWERMTEVQSRLAGFREKHRPADE